MNETPCAVHYAFSHGNTFGNRYDRSALVLDQSGCQNVGEPAIIKLAQEFGLMGDHAK